MHHNPSLQHHAFPLTYPPYPPSLPCLIISERFLLGQKPPFIALVLTAGLACIKSLPRQTTLLLLLLLCLLMAPPIVITQRQQLQQHHQIQ